MKKGLAALLLILTAGFAALDYQRPTTPTDVRTVEILSLADMPNRNGHRLISVRMSNGLERTIETLTPFYYRPGDTAQLARFERLLFPDIYDFVSEAQ